MVIRLACLILAAMMAPAIAQNAGSVEGRVTSGVGHTGIGGVAVTVGAQHTTTDAGGSFRVAGLAAGEHTSTFEAAGHFKIDSKVRVDSGTATRLDIELIPYSSISGRVVDEEGHPMAGVRVEITQAVRGTGTAWYRWRALTDRDGRYGLDGLQPGTYLAMARPNPGTQERESELRRPVRTYYPGVSERTQAGRLVLTGGTQAAAEIRMFKAAVHVIRGMVYDDEGRAVDASVSLVPAEVLEEAEGETKAHRGVFEFVDVAPGSWRVLASTESGGKTLRGAGRALVEGHDVENVTVRLAAPFALSGRVEPAPTGKEPSVELYPSDAPPGLAAFARAQSDGTLQFAAVYPGRYQVNVFGTMAEHYLDSVMVGEQDVLGKEAVFAEGMPPVRVVFKPNAAGVRGAVENCGGASILLLPQDEGLWNYRFIQQASCDGSGHFTMGGLRPGGYYAVAVERIDGTGLDDLGTLRRLASMAERVQVDSGRVAYVELKVQRCPE